MPAENWLTRQQTPVFQSRIAETQRLHEAEVAELHEALRLLEQTVLASLANSCHCSIVMTLYACAQVAQTKASRDAQLKEMKTIAEQGYKVRYVLVLVDLLPSMCA
jgi:hypothetical protein